MNKYILVNPESNALNCVSIKYARIIEIVMRDADPYYENYIVVEILGLIEDGNSLSCFHVGEIFYMDMWDFEENYDVVNKTELVAKIL